MPKLLFISNLFPDAQKPVWGLDNANVLHGLSAYWEISVLALRPTLRGCAPFSASPSYQARREDECFAPRFVPVPYVPKMGSRWNHRLVAQRLQHLITQLLAGATPPDVLLCSWLYPDAVGLVRVLRDGRPSKTTPRAVLIAQGSDVHQYLENPIRRRLVLDAIASPEVHGVITRSRNLADRLSDAGAAPEKLWPIYNGVQAPFFRRTAKPEARQSLGLPDSGPICLFVGNLLPVKNPLFLVDAFHEAFAKSDPQATLLLIGAGPLRSAIEQRIRQLGLTDRVRLLGTQPPEKVALYLQACDLLCLSSWNEGFPNVILEAMASGRPVVSTDVGGIRELIQQPPLGTLVPPDDKLAYADALRSTARAAQAASLEDQIHQAAPDLSQETAHQQYHRLLQAALR